MEDDPSRRSEKRSKRSNDPIDHQIRGIVVQELAGGSDDIGQGRGRGSRKALPRRGSGQGSGSGVGRGGASHGAAGHGGPIDDGGREGETIPAISVPDTPPQFLECPSE